MGWFGNLKTKAVTGAKKLHEGYRTSKAYVQFYTPRVKAKVSELHGNYKKAKAKALELNTRYKIAERAKAVYNYYSQDSKPKRINNSVNVSTPGKVNTVVYVPRRRNSNSRVSSRTYRPQKNYSSRRRRSRNSYSIF